MAEIIVLKEIRRLLQKIDVTAAMKEGFIQYSNGATVVPPVGELLFEDPPGDVHIKYGYVKHDPYYVIKIASGFYENSTVGLPSSNGLMLLFNQQTGSPVAVLLDEGFLTDVRTAAAGALVANYFAPKKIKAVGIIGTGIQARLQLKHLQEHRPCKTVWVWGRNHENTLRFKEELKADFNIHIAKTPAEVAFNSNLILTTTPSEVPLLFAQDVQIGTHITAVGSDTADKQELEAALLGKADLVIVDSIPQSGSRGEVFRAVKSGEVQAENIIELGTALQDTSLQRSNDQQITIADLTGVAVQDIMITKAVYDQFKKLT